MLEVQIDCSESMLLIGSIRLTELDIITAVICCHQHNVIGWSGWANLVVRASYQNHKTVTMNRCPQYNVIGSDRFGQVEQDDRAGYQKHRAIVVGFCDQIDMIGSGWLVWVYQVSRAGYQQQNTVTECHCHKHNVIGSGQFG